MQLEQVKTEAVLPAGLPDGAEMENVPLAGEASGERAELALLTIPCADRDDAVLVDLARSWADADVAGRSLLISLQGAQMVWAPGRAAVLAPAERLAALKPALVEFSRHEAALRGIEGEIEAGWPDLETDSPLAFDFDRKSLNRREELALRFQRVISLRARLARLTPQVHRPLVHPPTLASQVVERLRERTRLADRLEFAGGQVEVFENVYEMCSQRSSDFMHTRKGHTLEMIIIVVLIAQITLQIVEYLSSLAE